MSSMCSLIFWTMPRPIHATLCPMVCIISRCGSRNTNHLVGTSQLSKAGTPRSSPLLVLSSSVGGVRGGSWEEPSVTVSNGGDPGLPCTVGANKITFAFCSAVFGCGHQIARHKLRETVHCIVRVTKTLKMFILRFLVDISISFIVSTMVDRCWCRLEKRGNGCAVFF